MQSPRGAVIGNSVVTLLVNSRDSIILTPCTSTQWKRTNTRKRTKKETPNSYIKLLNYRHQIVSFLQKTRAWSRSNSLQPFMTLVQISHYTSPNYTNHPQVNIHWIENFFTVHDFWASCACPEKTELPWKFSLYWIYLLPFRIFEQLALALKNRVAQKYSLYWIYFLQSGVLRNLRMPWKREGVLNS